MTLSFVTMDKHIDPRYKMAVEILLRFGYLKFINVIDEKEFEILYNEWECTVHNSGYGSDVIPDIIDTTKEEFPYGPEVFPNLPETQLNTISGIH